MQRNKTKSAPKTKKQNGPAKKQNNATQIMAPVNISIRRTGRRPNIRSSGRATTVTHTEFISDISSPGSNFNTTSFPINPGMAKTFPWLSGMAAGFESYLFKSLKFHYKPICPTSTAGVVSIAVDYDARDNSPANKQMINSYEGTVSCSVWDSIVHSCAGPNLRKFGIQRFTRTGANPANTDLKTYDIGDLYVASSNTPVTGTTLGEIWVSYTVDLFTPQMNATGVTNLNKKTNTLSTPSQASVITAAAGAISLAGEFLNDPIFAISKSFNTAGRAVFDLAFNPIVHGKDIFMTLKSLTGAVEEFRLGKPPNVIQGDQGSLVVSQKSLDGLWDWAPPASNVYYRSWITNVRPLADNTAVNTWIPQLRFTMPTTGSLKIMASLFGSPPYPDVANYTMLTLEPLVDPLAYDPTPWSIVSNAASRSLGSFTQESFETQRDDQYSYHRISTTPKNKPPIAEIDEIIDDYDNLSVNDIPSASIAKNIKQPHNAHARLFN